MRALVIEDDRELRQLIAGYLEADGFVVDTAADGEQGMYMLEEFPVDVAIVDLGLPKLSGIEIIRNARSKGRAFPIMILTARDGWQNKVQGLEAGADDYLVKPFHKEELLARTRALLRRSGGWSRPQLESGPFVLDTAGKMAMAGGRRIELTSFEYRVLEFLMMHAGEVVSKTTLVEHLYREDEERDSNVIEVFIRRLRAKLDPEAALNPIATLRGSGYRWNLPRK